MKGHGDHDGISLFTGSFQHYTDITAGGGCAFLRRAYHPPSSEGERPEFNPDDYFLTNEAGEQMHEDVRDTMFYL